MAIGFAGGHVFVSFFPDLQSICAQCLLPILYFVNTPLGVHCYIFVRC